MMHKSSFLRLVYILAFTGLFITNGYAQKIDALSLDDVVKRILKQYPSIEVARIEVEQARQEYAKIQSQLGWVFSASTGVARDVAAFDVPSDQFHANVNFSSLN